MQGNARNKLIQKFLCNALTLYATCTATSAWAQATPSVSQPQGNLGMTSFYDGFSGSDPGWYYLGTFRYTTANAIKGSDGSNSPAFKNPKINALMLVNQVAYTSSVHIGEGTLGFNAILPVVSLSSSFGQGGATLQGNGTALGDLTIGPQLQFKPVMSEGGRPLFVQRFEFDAMVPIGQYRHNSDLNQGSGYYSLNPYWAATIFPTAKWEISWRLYYLYNFKNNNPASSSPTTYLGNTVTNTQAGQSTWVNFTSSYEVSPRIHAGINGYFFKQLENNRANGASMADSREQVLGIGPGMMIDIMRDNGKKDALWLNSYTEVKVRNRSRNSLILQARYVYQF
jgi:hypothetical protein